MMLMTDNRFEIINRAKEALLDSTNIEQSPDEMKVLDNFLFRCWQMDWLDCYDENKKLVELRQGHWNKDDDYIWCSECGMKWHKCDNDTETFNYCPNCGAILAELKGNKA